METTDPYEQQLLGVFESCNDYSNGSLSAAGLYQLCEKLQLEDHYNRLIKCLIGDAKGKRVSFYEFRDGFVKLLNGSDCDDKGGGGISPAREVSPKYVVGQKKYGRRSRPECNENESQFDDETDEILETPQSDSSGDDSELEESVPKKRRAKASKQNHFTTEKDYLGGGDLSEKIDQVASPLITSTTNEEECLISAWSSVSRGLTNSLSKDELVQVFQFVGLENGSDEAAQKVFEKLGFEDNGKITLQELLEFIRSGVSLSKDVRTEHLETDSCQKNSLDFIDSTSLSSVTGANLIEQWESAGVPGAAQLLQNLGLSVTQQVDVSSLVSVLSEELKSLNDEEKSARRNLDPYVALLRASSVLQNIYVQCLKSIMEHMNAEKEKLRNDVVEANQRALLLAQEVDDHHSKLEHSTQQQVKIIEQRHAEKMRELTLQLKSEQEALAAHNSVLEQRVAALEEEENKNKALISQFEMENKMLEQEHQNVMDQLSSLQMAKEKLEKDLESLSGLQQKVSEMESAMNDQDVITLLERIQTLEAENTNLRDRNDELSIEVEELSAKLSNTCIKKRSSPSNSFCINVDESMEEDNVSGVATKRRGESFSLLESAEDSGGEEGSPRLGKLRKCSHAKDYVLTTTSLQGLQIDSLGRGESLEDDLSDSLPLPLKSQNVTECSSPRGDESLENLPFSLELKQVTCLDTEPFYDKNLNGADIIKIFNEKLDKLDNKVGSEIVFGLKELLNGISDKKESCHDCTQKDNEISRLKSELNCQKETFESEKAAVEKRCKDLENSLELLREEYEKTEDYWADKLEEERILFEKEHKLSDEKYAELVEKIMEYEDLLNMEREQKQRLETIDEKASFEKQMVDMEQECYELRSQFTETLKLKETEIDMLKSEIVRLRHSRDSQDTGIQVSDDNSSEMSHSDAMLKKSSSEGGKKCKVYSRRSFTFSSGDRKSRYCGCSRSNQAAKLMADIENLKDTKVKYQHEINLLAGEREILYKDIIEKRKELTNYNLANSSYNSKIHYLEQKCRSLVATLRQQQKQTEELLTSTWRQHKLEVKDLKTVLRMTEDKLKRQTKVIQDQLNKLSKTDMLVKELFVENSYLISSVQKLEQQCNLSSPSKHSV